MRSWLAAGAAVALLASPAVSAAPASPPPPPVIAVLGEAGLNVLHEEFRLASGTPARFPRGMPAPVRIDLPRSGSWDERMGTLREGPLGHMTPGVLYWIAGTRLLLVAPDPAETTAVGGDDAGVVFVDVSNPGRMDQLAHGTGVVGAAVGASTGTAPRAFALYVVGKGAPSWQYLADQPWIDVATISNVELAAGCAAVPAVRAFRASGRVPFTAVGNTQDASSSAELPNGIPEFFHVGGVGDDGHTRLTPDPGQSNSFHATQGPQRPYDVGELFTFDGPDSTSTSGRATFGGTSGASPRVAGRAAVLIDRARRLLQSAARPRTGPLADGRLTADELEDLLHHTAIPAEQDTPLRYEVEGYGALTDASMSHADAVLRGGAVPAARVAEDDAHQRAESVRAALAERCS